MNISYLSKAQYAKITSIILFVIIMGIGMASYGFHWVQLLVLVDFVTVWIVLINIRFAKISIQQISHIIDQAKEGNLESRLVLLTDHMNEERLQNTCNVI